MKKSMLRLVLTAALLATVGCGIGADGMDETKAKQRKDAKALEERYDRVRGTYEGTLANPAEGLQPVAARFVLYVVNVNDGTNPDGSVVIRPALYGRFQLVDSVSAMDYVSLVGEYTEIGELDLAPKGGAAEFSLKGSIFGDNAKFAITRGGGTWGYFSGRRTTWIATAPSSGDLESRRQRLERIYSQVEGVYTANLQGGSERSKVEITITVAEAEGLPVLVGQFRRLDFPPGIGEKQLTVVYDAWSRHIQMNAISGSGSVPGSGYMSVAGNWDAGVLTVTFRDHRGLMGQITAARSPLR